MAISALFPVAFLDSLSRTQVVASILFGLLLLRLLSNRFQPGLSSIPGPTLAKYTRLWKFYDAWAGDSPLVTISLHRKYGDAVRIGPNHVTLAHPQAIAEIYTSTKPFLKTPFYSVQKALINNELVDSLFSARDPVAHRNQKKVIGHAYSMSAVLEMEQSIDSCITLFLSQLKDRAKKKEVVNFGVWIQFYTFDVTGELSFAQKFGFLREGRDFDNIMPTIVTQLSYGNIIGQIPELNNLLVGNRYFRMLFPQLEKRNHIMEFTMKAIKSRMAESDAAAKGKESHDSETPKRTGTDMLSRWMTIHEKDPEKMSEIDLLNHLSTNVFAGSDTQGIFLRSIFDNLMRNPEKLRKARQEVDDATSAGKLSDFITYNEVIAHLPYVCASIKEGMRLHPSVGQLLERLVPSGGATICGRFYPEGTVVGVNAWASHRHPDFFQDPGDFIPERWLESSQTQLKEMERAIFYFGGGSRTCIGKNMALSSIHKLLARFLREMDVKLHNPDKPLKLACKGIVIQTGLLVDLEERKSSAPS